MIAYVMYVRYTRAMQSINEASLKVLIQSNFEDVFRIWEGLLKIVKSCRINVVECLF